MAVTVYFKNVDLKFSVLVDVSHLQNILWHQEITWDSIL